MGVSVNTERRYVSRRETIAYGLANGGQFLSNFLSPYINYFFINVFHINSNAVAAMLLFEGFWDTVNDPLMGTLVDRTRTRWGKLRPYLLAVPLPLALTTILMSAGPMLLHNPSENAASKIVYMFVTYVLWEFFFTVCDIPFWSMSVAISPNPQDRTRVITSARFLSSFFSGLPIAVIPMLLDLAKNSATLELREVFFGLGLFSGITCFVLFSLAGLFTRERIVQSSKGPSLRECFQCILHNPPLRILILRSAILSFAGIGNSFATYYFVDVLGSASYSILAGLPGAVTNLIAYALIPIFKKRLDNKQIIFVSQLSLSLLNAFAYFAGLGNFAKPSVIMPLIMLQQGIMALFNGVEQVVPTEMIGETVDYTEWTTGLRSEGVSFAMQTFLGKLTSTVARSLGAFLLKPIGYKTSAINAIIPQSMSTKKGIWFMFMASPTLFRVLSLIPMFFYDLVGEKRERMLRELSLSRAMLTQDILDSRC